MKLDLQVLEKLKPGFSIFYGSELPLLRLKKKKKKLLGRQLQSKKKAECPQKAIRKMRVPSPSSRLPVSFSAPHQRSLTWIQTVNMYVRHPACESQCNSSRSHGLQAAHQALLSMGFSRREYWSGLPFPSPGDLPDPGIKPGLLLCRQILQFLSHQGSQTSKAEMWVTLSDSMSEHRDEKGGLELKGDQLVISTGGLTSALHGVFFIHYFQLLELLTLTCYISIHITSIPCFA